MENIRITSISVFGVPILLVNWIMFACVYIATPSPDINMNILGIIVLGLMGMITFVTVLNGGFRDNRICIMNTHPSKPYEPRRLRIPNAVVETIGVASFITSGIMLYPLYQLTGFPIYKHTILIAFIPPILTIVFIVAVLILSVMLSIYDFFHPEK